MVAEHCQFEFFFVFAPRYLFVNNRDRYYASLDILSFFFFMILQRLDFVLAYQLLSLGFYSVFSDANVHHLHC